MRYFETNELDFFREKLDLKEFEMITNESSSQSHPPPYTPLAVTFSVLLVFQLLDCPKLHGPDFEVHFRPIACVFEAPTSGPAVRSHFIIWKVKKCPWIPRNVRSGPSCTENPNMKSVLV